MQADLDRVTQWLIEATTAVPSDYIALPVAGVEGTVYRERVYCYELYHQWRQRWNAPDYTLCGEIDKQGHPVIRSRAKPDFLVHAQGTMTNLLAIEVKPSNASVKKMVKDLRTLTHFRRRLGEGSNYFAAYFVVYGLDNDGWRDLGLRIRNRVHEDEDISLDLIQPLIHIAPANAAQLTTWP